MDNVQSPMFRRLFQYISGQNNQEVKIAMTTPVSVLIEPGQGPNCENKFTMAFYIPAIHQDSPPIPTDLLVKIEDRPELNIFAR